MIDPDVEHVPDPWDLLSKAEYWRKLGFGNEAVIAADEAVEFKFRIAFDKLGVPKPVNLIEVLRILRKKGTKLSNERLLKLKNIREKADKAPDDDLSQAEVEMALSIAEDSICKISQQQESTWDRLFSLASHAGAPKGDTSSFKFHAGRGKTSSPSTINSFSLIEPLTSRHKEVPPVESDFVMKLLLARSILDYRKKRVPRPVGLAVLAMLIASCSLFGMVGASGIILTLSGRSLFSVIGLASDLVLIFIAYLFLRIALCVKGATR